MVGWDSDPVRLGLVDNLRRPGGNTTGTHSLVSALENKRLEILKQVEVTKARRDLDLEAFFDPVESQPG